MGPGGAGGGLGAGVGVHLPAGVHVQCAGSAVQSAWSVIVEQAGGWYCLAVNSQVMSFIVSNREPTSTHLGVVVPFGTGMLMSVTEPYTFPLLDALQYGMQNKCIGAYDEW